MPSLGTHRRLRRLQGPGGRLLLLAADHGLPAGPLPGLEDPASLFATLPSPPITGVIANAGIARFLAPESPAGLVVHLSAGTLLSRRPTSKVLSTSVARAVRLGADAVSVQVHFGDAAEDRMLSDAGAIVDEADGLGVPAVIMAYPPGATDGSADLEAMRHAARAAAEIGADLVQIAHPGSEAAVRAVVRGCPVPVLTAGGPRAATPAVFLDAVVASLAGGAAGVSVGRNLFQHPQPAAFARELGDAVFGSSLAVVVPGA